MTARPPLLASVDELLRAEGRFGVHRGAVPWRLLLTLLVIGGLLYGMVMGSFSLRPLQASYSAMKVPLLLAVSSAVCLPNFFVVNTMLGLRDDFSAALRGVLAAQATVAIALASFAPITAVVYASTEVYNDALVLNGVAFALATACGQITLSRHYRVLEARDPRHRIGKRIWLTLYVFVAIQLAWVLRPFIGSPTMETHFFRQEAWSNAYVVVWKLIVRFFGG